MAQKSWCRLSDLNQRPSDYKSDALPAELNRRASVCTTKQIRIQAFFISRANFYNIFIMHKIPGTLGKKALEETSLYAMIENTQIHDALYMLIRR